MCEEEGQMYRSFETCVESISPIVFKDRINNIDLVMSKNCF